MRRRTAFCLVLFYAVLVVDGADTSYSCTMVDASQTRSYATDRGFGLSVYYDDSSNGCPGQQYMANISGIVSSIAFRIRARQYNVPTTVKVYNSVSRSPSALIATSDVAYPSLSASYDWTTFSFSTPWSQTAGVKYYLYVDGVELQLVAGYPGITNRCLVFFCDGGGFTAGSSNCNLENVQFSVNVINPACCPSGCRNGGTCNTGGTCTCSAGWTGLLCTTKICSPSCECGCVEGGGICNAPVACNCAYTNKSFCHEPLPQNIAKGYLINANRGQNNVRVLDGNIWSASQADPNFPSPLLAAPSSSYWQQWLMVPLNTSGVMGNFVPSRFYAIINAMNGMALDANPLAPSSVFLSPLVEKTTGVLSDSHQWLVLPQDNNKMTIINKQTGFCLGAFDALGIPALSINCTQTEDLVWTWRATTGGVPSSKLISGTSADRIITDTSFLNSVSGVYNLNMQPDGNVVVYGPRMPVWSSQVFNSGRPFTLVMQNDGNLAAFNSAGTVIWSTNIVGNTANAPYTLTITNDGRLLVTNKNSVVTWKSA